MAVTPRLGAPVVSSDERPGRDMSIQGLRGLAVLLLVAGHVYGLIPSTGMRVSGDTVGRYLTDSLEFLRMPLFTVISGYVYALRPVRSTSGLPRMVKGKARRLLVPLVPLTAVIGGLQIAAARGGDGGPTVAEVALGYLYGYSHLWFLQAIFIVFVVVGVLDAAGRLSTTRGWATATVVGVLLYVLVYLPDRVDVLSANGAIQLFPFFLLGYGLRVHARALGRRAAVVGGAVLFAVSFALDQVVILTDPDLPGWARRGVLAVAGVTGVYCVFLLRRHLRLRVLAWIGTYAFTIYLLHTVANSGAKIGLELVGVDAPGVVFTVGLVAAILGPVVFHVTVGRITWVRVLLLGEKPLEPVAPTPERSATATGDAAGGPALRAHASAAPRGEPSRDPA